MRKINYEAMLLSAGSALLAFTFCFPSVLPFNAGLIDTPEQAFLLGLGAWL
jgi:hypothetical protein